MPIQFNCPNCGHDLTVPDDSAGMTGRCKHCDQRLRIPVAEILSDDPVPMIRTDEQHYTPLEMRRRSPSKLPRVLLILAVGGVLGAAYWAMKSPDLKENMSGVVDLLPESIKPDQDKVAVAKWLGDNLNDGDWEEVKWWPAVTLPEEIIQSDIQDLKESIAFEAKLIDETMKPFVVTNVISALDDDPQKTTDDNLSEKFAALSMMKIVEDAQGRVDAKKGLLNLMQKARSYRVCRLKYRARNTFNAMILTEQMFVIFDGKAYPILDENPNGLRLRDAAGKALQ